MSGSVFSFHRIIGEFVVVISLFMYWLVLTTAIKINNSIFEKIKLFILMTFLKNDYNNNRHYSELAIITITK